MLTNWIMFGYLVRVGLHTQTVNQIDLRISLSLGVRGYLNFLWPINKQIPHVVVGCRLAMIVGSSPRFLWLSSVSSVGGYVTMDGITLKVANFLQKHTIVTTVPRRQLTYDEVIHEHTNT